MNPSSTLHSDSLQITNEQIREAFSQKPELSRPLDVAVYNATSFRTSLADSLRGIDGVNSVHKIPPVLVEGSRPSHRWWTHFSGSPAAPLKKLRLRAAQTHSDLIVFFSVSHQYKEEPNWLAPTYSLLVTALFVPGRRATIKTDADVFFIDTRNGYLYDSYHDRTQTKKSYVKLNFEQNKATEIAEEHVNTLIPGIVDAVRSFIRTDRFYKDSTSRDGK